MPSGRLVELSLGSQTDTLRAEGANTAQVLPPGEAVGKRRPNRRRAERWDRNACLAGCLTPSSHRSPVPTTYRMVASHDPLTHRATEWFSRQPQANAGVRRARRVHGEEKQPELLPARPARGGTWSPLVPGPPRTVKAARRAVRVIRSGARAFFLVDPRRGQQAGAQGREGRQCIEIPP
jgi:hypothetical protein